MTDPIEVLKELATRCEDEFSYGKQVVFLEVDRLGIAIRATDKTKMGEILQNRKIIPWDALECDLIAHKILEDTVEEVVRVRVNADSKTA